MGNLGRLVATVAIWMMVPASLGMTMDVDGVAKLFIVLILAGAATLTSCAIWVWGNQPGAQVETEKAKRAGSRRVSAVIDALDEDDLAELRERLLANDGELPVPLDYLLASRERRSGR